MELAIAFGRYLMSLTQEQRDYNSVENLYQIFETINNKSNDIN
jgi:hypothetical protein